MMVVFFVGLLAEGSATHEWEMPGLEELSVCSNGRRGWRGPVANAEGRRRSLTIR